MPIAVTVVLSVLLLLLLALLLRVKFTLEYREAVVLKWHILGLSFALFPKTEKHVHPRRYTPRAIRRRKRRAQKKRARKLRRANKRAKRNAKKTGGKPRVRVGLHENVILLRALAAALLRKTGKRLHLKAARVHIRVATGDAATTAVLYGAVCASLAYLLAILERTTRLTAGPKGISVVADYLAERPTADVRLVFSARVWELLALLFTAALAAVKHRHTKKQKRTEDKL